MKREDILLRVQTLTTSLLISILLVPSPLLAGEKLTVYTVNYPLQYFAERIGGEYVEVIFPAPGDEDPKVEPEPVQKKKPGKVSIIELGADDFELEVDRDDLTIEGVEEATVECPGCSKNFSTPLGGRIKCPFCGLEGETD